MRSGRCLLMALRNEASEMAMALRSISANALHVWVRSDSYGLRIRATKMACDDAPGKMT